MGTLSLVSEYLKDLEECMDDGDSRVAKEAKLFDALEHKSVVIEVDNQKIAIFTKAPLRAFGEPFMRYSLPCKVDRQGAWDAELDLADSANYVMEKVLENMGFVHGEPSVLFGRDFLATTKSQVDFGLGEIRMNLTKFKEGIDVIDLLEEVGSSSGEVVQMGKENRNKGYNINKLTPPPSLRLEEIPPTSTIPPQPIYHPLTPKQKEKMKEGSVIRAPNQNELDMADNNAAKDWEKSKFTIAFGMHFLKNSELLLRLEEEGEDDWLGSFEVGRDEDGNVKLGPVAPSFIDIEDDMERVLAIEAYFNPFKMTYKKVDGDGDWHARFEVVTPSERKFNRTFKTKTTTRKLSGKFKTEDILSRKDPLPNPLIAEYEKRNKRNTITYSLQPMSNANLKWRDLSSMERHAYCYLEGKELKLEFLYAGVGEDVNRTIWDEGEVIMRKEVEHHLFEVYFGRLEFDDKQFDHKDYWTRVEESRGVNLAWIIADHLYKHAPGTKENSVICVGYYVTKIACFLCYCVNDEIKKFSEPIDCEYWTSRMLADELDEENTCLKKETEMPT
ncbi:hypothetical protein Tco_0610732 [Tanacetum coccineum]